MSDSNEDAEEMGGIAGALVIGASIDALPTVILNKCFFCGLCIN